MDRGWSTDLRYVLRVLRKSPGFVAVSVLSLAIGIGANASIFGTVRALLVSPMAVEAPDELRIVAWRRASSPGISQISSTNYPDPRGGPEYRSNFSHPMLEAMRVAVPEGVEIFGFSFLRGVSVGVGEAPATLAGGMLVDGNAFSALRPPMALGRPIGPEDDRAGAPLVVVLGHAFWMRAFGGDPGAVGRTIRVNGRPVTVVGVTGRDFIGLSRGGFFPRVDVTLPLAGQARVTPGVTDGPEPLTLAHDTYWVRVMARVPAPVAEAPVAQALTSVFHAQPTSANEGDDPPAEVALLPGGQGAQPVREAGARMLYVLLGVVAVVFLIACVNLASLLLARGVARRREMAVRKALGGGRARLFRQTFLECLVLAGLGTVAGVALAMATRELLGRVVATSAGSASYGRIAVEAAVDPVVVGFAGLLGLMATLLFGTLPALRLSDVDPITWLKHRGGGGPRLLLGRALLAGQIGVSVPLLVGSALLLRTVANLGQVELGFDADGVSTFQLDPEYAQVPEEEHGDLYLRVLEEVRRIPGVEAVSLVENELMAGIVSNSWVTIDGVRHNLHLNAVGPDYLRTTGMQLREGRMPGLQDGRGAPPVAAVNERVVREVFGGRSPIGATLRVGSTDFEIIGVVNDSRYASARAEVPATVFPSALQRTGYGGTTSWCAARFRSAGSKRSCAMPSPG